MTIRQKFATFLLAASILGRWAWSPLDTGSPVQCSFPAIAVAATARHRATSAAAALATWEPDAFAVRFESARVRRGCQPRRRRRLACIEAWLPADQPHQIALLSALTQVGVPYRRNTQQGRRGLRLLRAHGLRLGASRRRTAAPERDADPQAAARTLDTAQAGDLVYYPGHVMMWLGVDDLIVHAVGHGRHVEVGHISDRRVQAGQVRQPDRLIRGAPAQPWIGPLARRGVTASPGRCAGR